MSRHKKMSKEQYFKIIKKELQRINKKIDDKILRGEEYLSEAREHKLLLRKIRQYNRRNLWARIFSRLYLRFY